jgi:hypothetical protein
MSDRQPTTRKRTTTTTDLRFGSEVEVWEVQDFLNSVPPHAKLRVGTTAPDRPGELTESRITVVWDPVTQGGSDG